MKFARSKTWTELDESMFKSGWIRVALAAEKMGVHVATVHTAVREEMIECIVASGRRYVKIESCIEWLGPEASAARGLLGKKRAS